MSAALSLWGYEISGGVALISIGLYLALSVLLIWLWPKIAVRKVVIDQTKVDDVTKLLDARGKVRASIVQVVAGIVAVAAFVTTIQQIHSNEDAFNQKKADLFSKSLKELLSAESQADSRAEAIYELSFVARSDKSYHRAVYDALASFVRERSATACVDDNYRKQGFRRDPTVQLAMRIIGERKVGDDPTGKQLNLEGGCFVELDLIDEPGVVKGLSKARLSGSRMLRSDFGRVDLSGAQLMGIDAGDYLNPDWTAAIGRELHDGDVGDSRKGKNDGNERRRFVAHFIDANLVGADFTGAGLQGADFSGAKLKDAKFNGAVVSRASFKGAQDLSVDQLRFACVGRPDMSDDEFDLEQPYFSAGFRADLKNDSTLKGKIPRCK
jgi:uncharacterized protein YjbI with pentapeptide repeats